MKRLTLFLLLIALPFSAFTAWNTDPSVRNPVVALPGTQSNPRSCSDGNGGVIITWLDQYKSVYAKRITKNGTPMWGNNGIAIFTGSAMPVGGNPYSATVTAIVADGTGGAIILYEAVISGGTDQIYAEHIDGLGNLVWASPIKITNLLDSRLRWGEEIEQFGLSADGAGGAFITWQAYGSVNGFIFAQHIDTNGNLLWGSTGIGMPIINNHNGYFSSIVNTGNGTAVVAYEDGVYGLYLQRLKSDGSFMWAGNGVQISSASHFQGHAILAYDANPAKPSVAVAFLSPTPALTSRDDVFIQKIDLNGNVLWQPGGINITKTPDINEFSPDLVVNKQGRVFMTYVEYGGAGKARVQRINSSNGALLWGVGGIITKEVYQNNPVIVDDGVNGIFFMSAFNYNGNSNSLFAQRYNPQGTALWGVNGVSVIQGNAYLNHNTTPLIASTGGRAIATWVNSKAVGDYDIYAAKF